MNNREIFIVLCLASGLILVAPADMREYWRRVIKEFRRSIFSD